MGFREREVEEVKGRMRREMKFGMPAVEVIIDVAVRRASSDVRRIMARVGVRMFAVVCNWLRLKRLDVNIEWWR